MISSSSSPTSTSPSPPQLHLSQETKEATLGLAVSLLPSPLPPDSISAASSQPSGFGDPFSLGDESGDEGAEGGGDEAQRRQVMGAARRRSNSVPAPRLRVSPPPPSASGSKTDLHLAVQRRQPTWAQLTQHSGGDSPASRHSHSLH